MSWEILGTIGLLLLTQSTPVVAAGIFGGDGGACTAAQNLRDRKDYRLRNTTATLRWKAEDTYKNHLALALSRMKSGDYSKAVIHDLDFLLARWPNHYPALQALTAYEAAGGVANKFIPVSCYFQRAHWFVPNDANLFVLYGIYKQRLGQDDIAKTSWEQALVIDDKSAEAHYNLGLMYLGSANFPESVKHARLAYGLGYPLPGLKRKLVRAGHWK